MLAVAVTVIVAVVMLAIVVTVTVTVVTITIVIITTTKITVNRESASGDLRKGVYITVIYLYNYITLGLHSRIAI